MNRHEVYFSNYSYRVQICSWKHDISRCLSRTFKSIKNTTNMFIHYSFIVNNLNKNGTARTKIRSSSKRFWPSYICSDVVVTNGSDHVVSDVVRISSKNTYSSEWLESSMTNITIILNIMYLMCDKIESTCIRDLSNKMIK